MYNNIWNLFRKLLFCTLFLVLLSFLFSCRSTKQISSKSKVSSKGKIQISSNEENYDNYDEFQFKLIKEARKWLGTPYCYGGEDENCLDCSGFVLLVFKNLGISLPRTSKDLFDFCQPVDSDNALAGDLIFFKNADKISHVGIYAGNGWFYHASSSNGVIRQSINDDYYRKRFAGFGRVKH